MRLHMGRTRRTEPLQGVLHDWQELKRHLKREYAKLLNLLQAYALIATGVRIICTNQARRHSSYQQSYVACRMGFLTETPKY